MLGDPQIKDAVPAPSKMMMMLIIISVVIIVVVIWSGCVAAQEADMTLRVDSAPGKNEEDWRLQKPMMSNDSLFDIP